MLRLLTRRGEHRQTRPIREPAATRKRTEDDRRLCALGTSGPLPVADRSCAREGGDRLGVGQVIDLLRKTTGHAIMQPRRLSDGIGPRPAPQPARVPGADDGHRHADQTVRTLRREWVGFEDARALCRPHTVTDLRPARAVRNLPARARSGGNRLE
jgi:hypothetical protein